MRKVELMDWTTAASSEGAYERLPEGYHKVKVSAAYRHNKDGKPYETSKGPYVAIVFEDLRGSQAKQSFWLTEKAGWRLARALKAMGADLEKMTKAGVKLNHFLDESFCQKQLVGRDCWVNVEHSGDYANADVVEESDVPASTIAEHGATLPPEDDIPF